MNPDTGRLVKIDTPPTEEGYKLLPQRLWADASEVLGEKDSTYIDLNAKTALAKWAKKKRKKKRKEAKKARKRNKK